MAGTVAHWAVRRYRFHCSAVNRAMQMEKGRGQMTRRRMITVRLAGALVLACCMLAGCATSRESSGGWSLTEHLAEQQKKEKWWHEVWTGMVEIVGGSAYWSAAE